VAAGLATTTPLLAVGALGLEALWLLHAPGSRALKRLLWDKKLHALCTELDEKELQQKIASLDDKSRRRVAELMAEKKRIDSLAAQNPSFAGDLLRDELEKSEMLVRSFIDLVLTSARYDRYLSSIDVKQLDRERDMWQTRLKSGDPNPAAKSLAQKNLDVIVKRREKLEEIHQYLSLTRSQLDLIENTFALIADQIVTMQSPRELSGQLDELMTGVEAIRGATAYTDQLLA
jgi:hypothetical protein